MGSRAHLWAQMEASLPPSELAEARRVIGERLIEEVEDAASDGTPRVAVLVAGHVSHLGTPMGGTGVAARLGLLALPLLLLCAQSQGDDEVDPLLHYLATDPHGDQDVFYQMTAAEIDHFVDDAPELGVNELLEKSKAFPLSTHINIKLIGWDGRGRYGINLDEKRLDRALKELHSDLPVTMLGQNGDDGSTLTITNKFYFSTEHASNALYQAMDQAVGASLSKKSAGTGTRRVSRAVVDALLAQDFDSTSLSHTIYIANLDPAAKPTGESNDTDGVSLAYSYGEANQLAQCSICHWPASTLRYTFIDISAHCGRYGPRGVGEGVVNDRLLPLLHNHASVGELSDVEGRWPDLPHVQQRETELLGDMASYVWRTCKLLVSPALSRPVPFHEDTTVHLKVISDHDGAPNLGWWEEIERQVPQLGLQEMQTTHTSTTMTTMEECSECSAAFAHALRGHQLSREDGKGPLRPGAAPAEPQRYVDSDELHNWLGHYHASSGSARTGRKWQGRPHIFTVYLFDLQKETSRLLLDRVSQAVSFDDMVIAIQTSKPGTPHDYTCEDVGIYSSRDASGSLRQYTTEGPGAEVLGALLQTVWGVAPTHSAWHVLHNRTVSDYLWSLSDTPFSPFTRGSENQVLSWPLTDASRRSLLLTILHNQLELLHAAIAPLARPGFDLDLSRMLTAAETETFSKRWQLLNHKLDRFATEMYLNNPSTAFYFVKTVEFDIAAIHSLAHEAQAKLLVTLDCSRPAAPKNISRAKERALSYFLVFGLFGVVCYRGRRQ